MDRPELKKSLSRILLTVGFVCLLLTGFMLSIPPGKLPLLLATGGVFVAVLFIGTWRQRVIALLAVMLCAAASMNEIAEGKAFGAKHPGIKMSR